MTSAIIVPTSSDLVFDRELNELFEGAEKIVGGVLCLPGFTLGVILYFSENKEDVEIDVLVLLLVLLVNLVLLLVLLFGTSGKQFCRVLSCSRA